MQTIAIDTAKDLAIICAELTKNGIAYDARQAGEIFIITMTGC